MKNSLKLSVIALFVGMISIAFAEPPLKRAAFLGASWKSAAAPEKGIEITSVLPGSAAENNQLQKGDRVVAINGLPIADRSVFDAQYERLRAGDRIKLDVVRNGRHFQTGITLPPLPKEKWEGIETRYDAVRSDRGDWLRAIVTHPLKTSGRIPGIFLVGWLSCNSVEFPFGPHDGTAKLLHALLTRSGFAMMRVDKPGVGDSGGPPCSSCDFQTELAGYQAALRAFKKYDFVDPDNIILLGISNGAGSAPLVAENEKVKGYVVFGGWSKTWFEHMMEIERRRLGLDGKTPAEISEAMKGFEEFYNYYLIQKMTPGEVIKKHPRFASIWYDEPDHQYGRPAAFYQQLQDLNLSAAWAKVNQPVLVLYGEYDWIMSRSDHEWIAEIVNRNHPGLARFLSIPKMDHGFTLQNDMHGSFVNFGGGRFDDAPVKLILDWLHSTEQGVAGNVH